MGVLEGAHVVGAVAAHEDGEPLVPQTSHHALLLLGGEPGEHFDVGQDLAVQLWKVVPAGMFTSSLITFLLFVNKSITLPTVSGAVVC